MTKLAELKAEMATLVKAAKENTLTEEQATRFEGLKGEIESEVARVKAIEEGETLAKALDEGSQRRDSHETVAKSLGEHFVKTAGPALVGKAGHRGVQAAAPEFKAAADTHLRPGSLAPVVTDIDTNIVTGVRRRLTVEDLLGVESISGNALTYFVEGALEGDFAVVGEEGKKPQMHFADPVAVTEALAKVAGFIKESDELIEDMPFLKSAIDGRLLYQLGLFVENQLLNGPGTGGQITGLLEREGVQTETAADKTDNADALFRAIAKVELGSGLSADGIVINPADYQTLRLSKDANGQYFGGGFFAGQYGQGGIVEQPPLWGLRTVVTPAIAAGTALVGAFNQGGSVISKGGVRVDLANQHDEDFIYNRVTIRAERRLLLAVRRPAAYVKVTLSDADPDTGDAGDGGDGGVEG